MSLDDVNSMLGGRKAKPSPKFENVGDEFTAKVIDGDVVPVYNFKYGKPDEQMFWQNKRPTRQSALIQNQPFEPMQQIRVDCIDREGTEWTLWLEGDKLKKARAYMREHKVSIRTNGFIKVVLTELEDVGTEHKKKHFEVVIKEPKE